MGTGWLAMNCWRQGTVCMPVYIVHVYMRACMWGYLQVCLCVCARVRVWVGALPQVTLSAFMSARKHSLVCAQ